MRLFKRGRQARYGGLQPWPNTKKVDWYRWGLIAAAAAVVLLGGSQVLARTFTVEQDLVYDPCHLEYGTSVASWEGAADGPWNHKDYHYEAKIFKVSATAPDGFFNNVREITPTQLSSENCGASGGELINPGDDRYQWYGSKPIAVRLGVPDLAEVNSSGEYKFEAPKVRVAKELAPPLANKSYNRAAAWMDDAAKVSVLNAEKTLTKPLWCQDNTKNESCELNAPQEDPLRAEGYLFTGDNCPQELDCNQSSSWYGGFAQVREDFTELVGRNAHGELLPFHLRTEATSYFGHEAGAYSVLVFGYPKKPEVFTNLTIDPAKAQPGGNVTFKLSLSKLGPDLKTLTATTDLTDQPIKQISGFDITSDLVGAFNSHQEVSVAATYQLTGGEEGKCYSATINLAGESVLGEALSLNPLTARYCIASSIAATYTYDVASRGAIAGNFDEFVAQAAETFGAALGWRAAGVSFERVAAGGDFTLVLASPDQMMSFSDGCDSVYSCQSGRYVIINDERWRLATPSWNDSGGSLRDYRHLVINHEVGHWLGFGHPGCPAVGARAPVMMQQSVSLQGCVHNPWPTASEADSLKQQL